MNKFLVMLMMAGTLAASCGWAEESMVVQDAIKAVEVGNKICPVSGGVVGEMGEAFKYEHNGKIYNLCCGACEKDFDKDPAKYVKIAEDEVDTSAEAVKP